MFLMTLLCLIAQPEILSKQVEISGSNLLVPHHLGDIKVIHDGSRFTVIDKCGSNTVERYNLDKTLRQMNQQQLEEFLSQGYLSVKKLENDYCLEGHGRLLGGGPILAVVTGLGVAVGGIGCALTGNVPGMMALYYSAPLTITAAAAAPTP